MTGTTDSFRGKLKLWRTQIVKVVLTHFPSVQSHANVTYEAAVYILCTDRLFKEFKIGFQELQLMKFTTSFTTSSRDKHQWECSRKMWVKQNLRLLILQQTYHWKQEWMTHTSWTYCSEQYPILKQLSLKVKDRSSLNDKHLNDCVTVAHH
jgi:hypothetical protein